MSDEHAESASEPDEVAEAEQSAPVEEVSDDALDEVAGGFASEYVKPPAPST